MAAELKIGIGADNSGLKDALKDSEAQIKSFFKSLEGLNKIGEQLSSIGQKMSVGLTLPILALGAAAIKSYGDLQSLKMGLEAVMGSSQAASSEFEKLREVAKLPGLGLKEAAKGSVALQSAGFSADMARRSLMAFGNALATVGKGANELDFVNLALTQLQNKTSGFGQDLRQLTEQLPQLRGALTAAFGTADSEAIAKLGYTGAQVVQMITTEFEKLPKVTGGIKNAFENLSDNIFISSSRIGKIIDDTFDISGIIDKLTGYLDKAVSAFENLSPSIQNTILVVAGLAAAAGPLLVAVGGLLAMLPTLLSGLGAVKVAFAALTGPIGLVTLAIVGVVTAVVANWGKIKPYIINTINYFRELYNESTVVRIAVAGIATTFKNAFAIVSNILKTAWEIFKTFAKGTADLFAGVGTVLKGALTGDLGQIKAGLVQMSAAWATGIKTLSNDLGNGIKGLYNDIGKNLSDGVAMVKNNQLKPITDLKIFDEEKIAEKTEQNITKGVEKGVKKAKEKTVKIELPDIEPLDMGKTSGFINNLGEQFDTLLGFATRSEEISSMITNSFAKIPESISYAAVSVSENIIGLMDSFSQISDFGNFLGDAIATSFNFVTDTIADSFAAIGEAMATGGNIMSSVGNVILGGIASFLSTLGKQMIQYGVAALAMSVLSKMLLNPITAAPAAVAMIAAGAALSLIGGAIKGTLSGGGGSSSGSAGGGSQSYSSSYSSGGGFGNGGEVVFRISGNDLVGVLSRQQDKNTRLGG